MDSRSERFVIPESGATFGCYEYLNNCSRGSLDAISKRYQGLNVASGQNVFSQSEIAMP